MTIDIFLDRDGTLIDDTGYISNPTDVRILPSVVEGLKLFILNNYRLHIVSNQSGVGRGIISPAKFSSVEARVSLLFLEEGVVFDSINYCFHVPDDDCHCRKPRTGLFESVSSRFKINKESTVLIGNSASDQGAALNYGILYWGINPTELNSFYRCAEEIVVYFAGKSDAL